MGLDAIVQALPVGPAFNISGSLDLKCSAPLIHLKLNSSKQFIF